MTYSGCESKNPKIGYHENEFGYWALIADATSIGIDLFTKDDEQHFWESDVPDQETGEVFLESLLPDDLNPETLESKGLHKDI